MKQVRIYVMESLYLFLMEEKLMGKRMEKVVDSSRNTVCNFSGHDGIVIFFTAPRKFR